MSKKKKQSILIAGDIHLPYEHKDYLKFLKAIQKKHKCTRVTSTGDVLDLMTLSFYEKAPEADSTMQEIAKLKKKFKEWEKVFPKMEIANGNHENRISRRLSQAGIPAELVDPTSILKNGFGLPAGWEMKEEIELDTKNGKVIITHGDAKGISSVAGANLRRFHCSLIKGHAHSLTYLYYNQTKASGLLFEMALGYGGDANSVAFKYAKNQISQHIHSAGVVDADGTPYVYTMRLNKNGRWTGKL